MRVSVVICAYTMDRWDDLVAAVQSCVDQTLKPDEIVVVIDHNDELKSRASGALTSALVIANQSTKGLSGARNTGVVNSTGDVVAFLDDDAYGDAHWLEQLTAPLSDPAVVGVGGWILPHWETNAVASFPETFYWVFGCSYSGLPANNSRIRNPIGANMAMRRKVFTAVGGFTSGIGRIGKVPLGCEETELCIRYVSSHPNEYFVIARDAVVHHRVPRSRLTWKYFWTRCWAEGLSKAAVTSLVGSSSGLSSERRYVTRALPREFFQSVRSLRRQPSASAMRIAYMVAGTACACAGIVKGRVALRRTPLTAGTDGLDLRLTPTPTEEGLG
jgi:glycosyltransferase involved in cell wall biosynthesis